MKKEKGTANKW